MMQELVQEIENTARKVMEEIHTAFPGTVVSFDPGSGKAVVQPNGKYTSSSGKRMSYPRISDVPMTCPVCQAAGVGMAFPIKAGDSCIVIVSEVELDEWRSGAESEGELHFDLTNAVAVPGLLVGGGELVQKACAEDAVVLAAGTAEILVKEDRMTVTMGGTELEVTEEAVTVSLGDTELKLTEEETAIRGDLKVDGDISYTGALHGA